MTLLKQLKFALLPYFFFFSMAVSYSQTETTTKEAPGGSIISLITDNIKLNESSEAKQKLSGFFSVLFRSSDQHRLHGDYEKAMQVDFQILQLAEAFMLPDETGRAYNNIGINYYRLGSYEDAMDYFQQAAGIRVLLKDTVRLGDTYCNLGMLNDDMGNSQIAAEYYTMALEFFRIKEIYDGMADVYNGMAGHYYMQREIDSVTFYAEKALEMYEITGNQEAMMFMLINIAALKNMKGEHTAALEDLKQGVEIAAETNNLNQLRQGYRSLSETYAYMGRWEEAYTNHLIYEQYKDSVFDIEKTMVVEDLQTRYETQKTKEELARKKTELLEMEVRVQKTRNLRNIVILALVVVIAVASFLWLRYTENKRNSKILDEKNKQLATLNATKDRFFSLVSHDLKSPVSSLARLTSGLEKSMDLLEKDELKEYLGEMAVTTANLNEFLNKLLQWALSQKDGLKPQFEHIDLCAILQDVTRSLASQATLKQIQLREECTTSERIYGDRAMIETIVRNLVSNALKFGNEKSEVKIRAEKKKDTWSISVTNSGVGLTDEEAIRLFRIDGQAHMIGNHSEKGSGLGLILCHEFAKVHRGTITLVSHTPENTCFVFAFPANN